MCFCLGNFPELRVTKIASFIYSQNSYRLALHTEVFSLSTNCFCDPTIMVKSLLGSPTCFLGVQTIVPALMLRCPTSPEWRLAPLQWLLEPLSAICLSSPSLMSCLNHFLTIYSVVACACPCLTHQLLVTEMSSVPFPCSAPTPVPNTHGYQILYKANEHLLKGPKSQYLSCSPNVLGHPGKSSLCPSEHIPH